MKQRFHISRCCCGTPVTKIGRTWGHNIFYHTQCASVPDGQGGYFPASQFGVFVGVNGDGSNLDFGWTRNIDGADVNQGLYEADGYKGPRFYDTPVIFQLRDGIPDTVPGNIDESVSLPLTVNSATLNFRVYWAGYEYSNTSGYNILTKPYTFRIKGLWYPNAPDTDFPNINNPINFGSPCDELDSSRDPWEYPDGSQDLIGPGPSQPQKLTSSLAEFTIDNSSFPTVDPNDPVDIYRNPLDISVDITSVYQESMVGNTQPDGERNLNLWMYGVTPFPNPPALYQGNISSPANRPSFRIEWRKTEAFPTLVTT